MDLKKTLKIIKLNESSVKVFFLFLVIIIGGQILLGLYQKGSTSKIETPIGDEKFQNIHTVKSGDTLWKIAEQYLNNGFRWKEIADSNNLKDGDVLKEGQNLVIPSSTTPLPTPSDLNNPSNTSSTSTEAKTYSVKGGDTLWKIAEDQFGSGYNWVDIAKANSLKNAGEITEGQLLFIPNVKAKTSTIKDIQESSAILNDSYTVVAGDNLWDIAVRAYSDGYKWVEIAKVNKLQNPGIIIPNQVLTLPR